MLAAFCDPTGMRPHHTRSKGRTGERLWHCGAALQEQCHKHRQHGACTTDLKELSWDILPQNHLYQEPLSHPRLQKARRGRGKVGSCLSGAAGGARCSRGARRSGVVVGERRPQPGRTRSRGLGPPGPARCHRPTAARAVPEGISWRRQRVEARGHNPSPAPWAAVGESSGRLPSCSPGG